MNLDELVFDSLELITQPVRIGNKGYIATEASESARVQYQNAGARAARFNAEGNLSGVEGVANIEPLLVSLCLYEADVGDIEDRSTYKLRLDKNNEPDKQYLVPQNVINRLPSRVVGPIFDWIKEKSEIDKETVESLTKQINKLQTRLNKLKGSKDIEKKEQDDTTAT